MLRQFLILIIAMFSFIRLRKHAYISRSPVDWVGDEQRLLQPERPPKSAIVDRESGSSQQTWSANTSQTRPTVHERWNRTFQIGTREHDELLVDEVLIRQRAPTGGVEIRTRLRSHILAAPSPFVHVTVQPVLAVISSVLIESLEEQRGRFYSRRWVG